MPDVPQVREVDDQRMDETGEFERFVREQMGDQFIDPEQWESA